MNREFTSNEHRFEVRERGWALLAAIVIVAGAGCGSEAEPKPEPEPAVAAAISEYDVADHNSRQQLDNQRLSTYARAVAALETADSSYFCMASHVELADGRKVWLSADHCFEDNPPDQPPVEKSQPDRGQGVRFAQPRPDDTSVLAPRQTIATISANEQVIIKDDGHDLAVINIDTPDVPAIKLNSAATVQDVMSHSIGHVRGYPAGHRSKLFLGMPLHFQGMASDKNIATFSYILGNPSPSKQYLGINVHGYSGSGNFDPRSNTITSVLITGEDAVRLDPQTREPTKTTRAFGCTVVSNELIISYLPPKVSVSG